MQKSSKKGFYLYLHDQAIRQLRLAAKRRQRTVAAEATRILEETLRPGQANDDAVLDGGGTKNCNANGLYVDLSEPLLARLRPLAERNYRSLAGEAAFVLETVLNLTEGESNIKAVSQAKPILKFSKKPRPSKPAV